MFKSIQLTIISLVFAGLGLQLTTLPVSAQQFSPSSAPTPNSNLLIPGSVVHDPINNATLIAGFAKELAQTIAMIAVQKFATDKLSQALGLPIGKIKIDENTGGVTYEPPSGFGGGTSGGSDDPDVIGDSESTHVKPKAYFKYLTTAIGLLGNSGLLRKFPTISSETSKVIQDTILSGVGNNEETRKVLDTVIGVFETSNPRSASTDRLVRDTLEAVMDQVRVLAQNQKEVEQASEDVAKMPGNSVLNETSKNRMLNQNISKQLTLLYHQNNTTNMLNMTKTLREEAQQKQAQQREQDMADKISGEIISFFGGPQQIPSNTATNQKHQ